MTARNSPPRQLQKPRRNPACRGLVGVFKKHDLISQSGKLAGKTQSSQPPADHQIGISPLQEASTKPRRDGTRVIVWRLVVALRQ